MNTPYESKTSVDTSSVVKLQARLAAVNPTTSSPEVAELHYYLGVAFQAQGQFGEAIKHLTQSTTKYQILGDHPLDMALVFNQLAIVYLAQNKLEYTESYLAQALKLLNSNQNSSAFAETQHYLGLLYIAQKKYAQAVGALTQASTLYLTLGTQSSVAMAKVSIQLGKAYAAQHDYMRAHQAFTHALSILGEDTETLEVAEIHHSKGTLFLAQDDFLQATTSLNKALTQYRMLNADNVHALTIAIVLMKLGQVWQRRSNINFAISNFDQALKVYVALSSEPRPEVASIHRCLGELYLSNNQLTLAATSLTQALTLYQTLYPDSPEHEDITQTQSLLAKTQPSRIATRPHVQSESPKRGSWCCFSYARTSAVQKNDPVVANPMRIKPG